MNVGGWVGEWEPWNFHKVGVQKRPLECAPPVKSIVAALEPQKFISVGVQKDPLGYAPPTRS